MLNDTRMMDKPHLLPLEDEDDLNFYSSSSMSDKLSSTQNATMLSFDYVLQRKLFCILSPIEKKNVFQVAPVINYLFCNNEYPRNIRWYCESIRVRSKLSVNWCFHKYQILNNYSIFTLCCKFCCLLHFSWMPCIATLIIYLPFEFFYNDVFVNLSG